MYKISFVLIKKNLLFQVLFIKSEKSPLLTMSSEEDKPPAPPVRLTSNRGGDRVGGGITGGASGDAPAVDMKPLPKGLFIVAIIV